jgi:uncharacterized protein YyaL (SSP411 family)
MANRLASSTSPYLLQHAGNPVDWFEWGEEALAEARRRDVPILLSVGYSACHWCHVMAHESFEHPETAAEMNRMFVNVKVDREERPDVDSIYMEAVQAMTGHGGWPMTVWLTPDGQPFFAGTYFPRVDHSGMPSFRRVMAAVADAWNNRRSDVADQADRISTALSMKVTGSDDTPDQTVLESAYLNLLDAFDHVNGGFGRAPKFPQPPVLEFLLRAWDRPWAPEAGRMLRQTLSTMARGGIHDQLGGGFSRYSVDARWLVPHFEKMLYDNALLARLYLWAAKEFDEPEFERVARATLDYLLEDLRNEDGGFFSAEDADSEGKEGKFYVWGYPEFMAVTGDAGPIAGRYFGVSPAGNFEGANILHVGRSTTEVAEESGVPAAEAAASLEQARERLRDHRRQRIRPGLDDKAIAAWNGLAIRALAEAGAALADPRYLDAARDAARFVLRRMVRPDGILARSWAKGRAGNVNGFLEDYAALAMGLFALYAATGETEWFTAGEDLTLRIEGLFADGEGGLFASSTSELLKRPQDLFDNPAPSGTSLASEACLLLSLYTGDAGLRERALRYLRSLGKIMERYPSGAGHALAVLTSLERGTHELAVVGADVAPFQAAYWSRYRPHVVFASSDGRHETGIPVLEGRGEPDRTLAYLCTGFACLAPVDSPERLSGLLEST